MKKLLIASDHAAFEEKNRLIEYFKEEIEFEDLGTYSNESTSYSRYGTLLGQKIQKTGSRGIALCGSGIGISIAVNRFKGVRGALCRDIEDARLSREHNNSNVLCMGTRKNTFDDLIQIIKCWLNTEFEGGRHQKRIEGLDQWEN